MPELPRSIGPYRILEVLGRGGMGVVYRAVHPDTGHSAALKTVRVPREGLLQSLRREIHALARIRHPGVVRILDDGLQDGVPWYAMELLEGVTLRHLAARLWSEALPAASRSRDRSAPARTAETPHPLAENDVWWTHGLATVDLESAPSGPAAPEPDAAAVELAQHRLLGVARRLCAPLAFLHGEGLVHRDLKPDNVLVRPDGTPVLVDFGLMTQFAGEISREALEVSADRVGTTAYMAPEQILGGLVDARANLYALGCMLYEMLTGQPPFVGSSRSEVLQAHLRLEPTPPSGRVRTLPAALDRLVLRLLAKDPRERLGFADAVAAALAELKTDDGPGEPGPRARAYLYRPRLAGRVDTLAALESQLLRLEEGRGGVLLIGGESGVGKTRLVLEAARLASLRRVRVLTGECVGATGVDESGPSAGRGRTPRGESRVENDGRPPGNGPQRSAQGEPPAASGECGDVGGGQTSQAGERRRPIGEPLEPDGDAARAKIAAPGVQIAGTPLQALRQPLQAVADSCREHGPAETRRLLGNRARLLARYEPSLAGLPGQETDPEPEELQGHAARLRLYTGLADTFGALAAQRPVLLVLDDLQWADELTLGFLGMLVRSRRLDRSSLLVLGTYRTDEASGALKALLELPGVGQLALGRLGEQDVSTMAGDALAMDPPPALFVRFLARHSEGNPFFVAELLRTAVAEGLLFRDSHARWQVSEESRTQATEAVYEALPLPRSVGELIGRRLAGLSAEAWRFAEMAAVLGREADESVVAAAAGAGGTEAFEPIRELTSRQVLEEVQPGRLRFVHDKIREVAYERIAASDRQQLHRSVAGALESLPDAEREERLAELGRHWEQAGELALAQERYLAAARRAKDRYAYGEAEQMYRAYLALVEKPTEASLAARDELAVSILQVRGRYLESIAEHERELAEALSIGSLAAEVACRAGMGSSNYYLDRLDVAHPQFEQALALARRIGDRRAEAKALANLSLICARRGEVQEACELQEQSLAVARTLGDLQQVAHTVNNLATLWERQGRPDAQALLEQALAMARQAGSRMVEQIVLGNLGVFAQRQGRLEEAVAFHEQGMAIARERGNWPWLGGGLNNLADLRSAQGRIDEAQRLYRGGPGDRPRCRPPPRRRLRAGRAGPAAPRARPAGSGSRTRRGSAVHRARVRRPATGALLPRLRRASGTTVRAHG